MNETSTAVTNTSKNTVEVFFLVIFFLIGIFGNLSAIIIIRKNPRLQNLHNALIINLISIDLIVVIFCIFPITTSYATNEWIYGDVFCKINGYVLVTMNVASLWNIVVLSLCRYFMVKKPRFYSRIILYNMMVIIMLIWMTAMCSSAVVFSVGTYHYFPEFHACYAGFKQVRSNMLVLTVIAFIPSALLLILSVILVITVQSERRHHHGNNSHVRATYQESRATHTYLMLVFLIAICWIPLLAIHGINQVKSNLLSSHVFTLATFFGLIPFVIKPVIYGITKSEFRKSFMDIYKCCFCKWKKRGNEVHPSQNNSVRRITRALHSSLKDTRDLETKYLDVVEVSQKRSASTAF